MKPLRNTRWTKQLTQKQLSELTGISQQHISDLENSVFSPTQSTRKKIEKVLGQIDWIDESKIKLKSSDWYTAEKTLKTLVEEVMFFSPSERFKFNLLVNKYFHNNKKFYGRTRK